MNSCGNKVMVSLLCSKKSTELEVGSKVFVRASLRKSNQTAVGLEVRRSRQTEDEFKCQVPLLD